jgi:hypothetical protein
MTLIRSFSSDSEVLAETVVLAQMVGGVCHEGRGTEVAADGRLGPTL